MPLDVDRVAAAAESAEGAGAPDPLRITEDEFLLLAKALFVEQERMLPEGECWEDFSENDKSYWTNSAKAVIRELGKLRGTT